MKSFLLLPVLFLGSWHLCFAANVNCSKTYSGSDTTITHALDGKLSEWPAQNFQTDLETEVRYAVDDDQQNLYLALIIPNQRTQNKAMRNGMEVYIDLKGKKKEGKGVEFPVKRDAEENPLPTFTNSQTGDSTNPESQEQRRARMKAMRAQLTLNLTSIKVFGFEADKNDEQGLKMPGSANVAFAWDSSDAMCIEYKIPFALLETTTPLAEKDVSIGWKINGFVRNSDHPSSSGSGSGRRGGYGGGHRGNFGGGSSGFGNQGQRPVKDIENAMKDQSFWFKYMFKEK